MLNKKYFLILAKLILLLGFISCGSDPAKPDHGVLQLTVARVGTNTLNLSDFSQNNNLPVDKPIVVSFSAPLLTAAVEESVILKVENTDTEIPVTIAFLDDDKTISMQAVADPLQFNKTYALTLTADLRGAEQETFPGYTIKFTTAPSTLTITSLKFNNAESISLSRIKDVPVDNASIDITFSVPLDAEDINTTNFSVLKNGIAVPVTVNSADNKIVHITPTADLNGLMRHQLLISGDVRGADDEVLSQYSKFFYTAVDPDPVFPVISDDALLTLVQQKTFNYFWDFAQASSGMARERNTSGDLVTSGGSGFGIMAIIVGIERNFITRNDGLTRLDKILDYLETSDRFHGAWPHWLNGNTGKVIPFSADDNGGDLVETAFLVEGLITFRQYLNSANPTELLLINRINALWESVEWDWYTRGGQNVLYWHWSPDKEWIMNHQIKGWNECLITYVLAASSPTHTIPASAYQQGWATNGGMLNGKTFYSIKLPLGQDYGGPLFFTHYSFLGLNPENLTDTYANYWEQNVNHTKINYTYCVNNTKNFVGYSDQCWGLTASDNQSGYSAHSPTNDLGVITPTAALSSFPYTPDESMKALKFFYYNLGDRLWGTYGFYDAFNITENWFANSYLAIDQGPIVVMIENHRTGFLWDLFMSAPEVQAGLTKLGFTY